MPRKTKTWAEKMQTGAPHVTVLERAFAGAPAGSKLWISSPLEMDAYLRSRVRPGQRATAQQIRRDLAAAHGADATCPLTTGIFLRIIAEHAWDQLQAGADLAEVTPFWRAVEPGSELAGKLRAGAAWIARQRGLEGIED
jgi:hypothetical protein